MKKLLIPALAFSIICGLTFTSCTNDDSIGLNIQPPSDQIEVEFSNASSLIAYSKIDDSVRTDEVAQCIAGYYYDPVFGYTYSEFATQVRLSANNVDFGSNPVADSIVLNMKYYTVYSDTKRNNKITLNVYKLNEAISKDSDYYSNRPINKGILIGSKTFLPNSKDSVYFDGGNKPPMVRIKLDPSFANELITASQNGHLTTNTEFLNYLNGIVVSPSTNIAGGALISFDNLSAYTNITFYYHNDSGTGKYAFDMNSNCARYSFFNHYNYANANAALKAQVDGDTALGNQKLYLQPMAGTRIKIRFPNIKAALVSGKDIAINKAELIIPYSTDDVTSNIFTRPVKMNLTRNSADTSNVYVEDQVYSASTFGGDINTSKGYYSFILTRYIQNIISHPEDDYGLYLYVSGNAVRPYRVIINGPGNLTNPMKLKVTYTILK